MLALRPDEWLEQLYLRRFEIQPAPGTVESELIAQTQRFIVESVAPRTRELYNRHMRGLARFCRRTNRRALPADERTVALYITYLAIERHYAYKSIANALWAISAFHRIAELPDPTRTERVRLCLRGIAREIGTRSVGKKPLRTSHLGRIQYLSAAYGARGARDYAMLSNGFGGAFRGGELVELDCSDASIDNRGVTFFVGSSKTDQFGVGSPVFIVRSGAPTCPVAALERWLSISGIDEGPLFRRVRKNDRIGQKALCIRSLSRIIKDYARMLALDERDYASHSLRSGCATELIESGAQDIEVMRHLRQTTLDSTAIYFRPDNPYASRLSARLGL